MAKRGPKIADKYMTATPGANYTADDWTPDYTGVTIVFRGGQTLSASLAAIPVTLHDQLACHGLSQKLGDSYAGAMGDVTVAYGSAKDVYELLKRGDWEKETREQGVRLGDLEEAVNTYRVEIGKAAYNHDSFMDAYTGPEGTTKRERAKAVPRVAAILVAIAQRKLAEKKAELDKAAESASASDDV